MSQIKDLKEGKYATIYLRIRGSVKELKIENAVVKKKNLQRYLRGGAPSQSFGEGTEVTYNPSRIIP